MTTSITATGNEATLWAAVARWNAADLEAGAV
jgi:hypothetical protein